MTDTFHCIAPDTLSRLQSCTLLVGLGAMKSGTTWLTRYLDAHPDFLHSPINEMDYFNHQFPGAFHEDGAAVLG